MGCTDFRTVSWLAGISVVMKFCLAMAASRSCCTELASAELKPIAAHLVQPALGGRELPKNQRTPRLGGQTRSKILQQRGECRIAGVELLQREIEILGVVVRRIDQPILQQPFVRILQQLAPGVDIRLATRGGEQILHRFNIRRDSDALGALDHGRGAREIPPVDRAARVLHQSRSQRALRVERRRIVADPKPRPLACSSGRCRDPVPRAGRRPCAASQARATGVHVIFFRFRLRCAPCVDDSCCCTCACAVLICSRDFASCARQEGDSAALDARLARGFDGGGGFVQPLLEQRIFGARQQPLVNFGQSGAGIGIGRIARLHLQIEFQRIVARGFGKPIGRQRRRGARQKRRFNRGGFRRIRAEGGGSAGSSPLSLCAIQAMPPTISTRRRWRRRTATGDLRGSADLRCGVSAARRR